MHDRNAAKPSRIGGFISPFLSINLVQSHGASAAIISYACLVGVGSAAMTYLSRSMSSSSTASKYHAIVEAAADTGNSGRGEGSEDGQGEKWDLLPDQDGMAGLPYEQQHEQLPSNHHDHVLHGACTEGSILLEESVCRSRSSLIGPSPSGASSTAIRIGSALDARHVHVHNHAPQSAASM
jgi:hypothetical protein